jgi:osmotically-inducible protein OsmY
MEAGMPSLATTRTDSELQQAVLSELRWGSRVDETEVGVEVQHGVVTLTGTVPNWAKRVAAEEAAHSVYGVLDVANDIEVKMPGTPGRTDTELAQAVRHALYWDVFVPEEKIRTTVSDGVVVLEGEVATAAQREDAEGAIRNLAGVRSVRNQIEVHAAPMSVASMRSAIEDALERRADRDARQVRIEVGKGGLVTLFGAVRSWRERRAVVGAVRGTAGVSRVEDRLRIDPFER